MMMLMMTLLGVVLLMLVLILFGRRGRRTRKPLRLWLLRQLDDVFVGRRFDQRFLQDGIECVFVAGLARW
jgi:hypothetical protein